jgi:hypothetical protein
MGHNNLGLFRARGEIEGPRSSPTAELAARAAAEATASCLCSWLDFLLFLLFDAAVMCWPDHYVKQVSLFTVQL